MGQDLVITGLSKTYPNGVRALVDVSLTIPTGMFGLLGPNGAGKSTLMRTIATLQEPDAGSIRLGDLERLTADAASILGLSRIDPPFFSPMFSSQRSSSS
jgi:ABC-type multidrug transport system ATPase subunit